MKMLTSRLAVAVVTLGGCGGSTGPGPGEVQGTVHGNKIQVADAVSAVASVETGTPNKLASIVLSTSGDLCADLRANVQHPSTAYVSIFLYDRTGDTLTTPSAPGEYPIIDDLGTGHPKVAGIGIFDVDADCFNLGEQRAFAASGTVDLSSLNGNVFEGTFDVTLTTGEQLSGDFAPTPCSGIDTFSTSQAGPACTR